MQALARSEAPRNQGYLFAHAAVIIVLALACAWVMAGQGFPGGSLLRRGTGQEGLTGGLTTAMRSVLRGDWLVGFARHRCAAPVTLVLLAQFCWRGLALLRPPPSRWWPIDLAVSLVAFALAIYLPWLLA